MLNPITVVLPSGGLPSLAYGNLLAGVVEYLVLRWGFGLRGKVWLGLLVVANLVSAALGGYPVRNGLPRTLATLDISPLSFPIVLLLSLGAVTFLLALLLEAPAYFCIFRFGRMERRHPWRALILANLASWPLTFGLVVYQSRSEWDLSLWARTSRASLARIAPPGTWVFFARDGRVYKRCLRDGREEDLHLQASDIQTLALDAEAGGWLLEMYAFSEGDQIRRWGKVLAPPSWKGPGFSFKGFEGSQPNPWKEKALNLSLLRRENHFTQEAGENPPFRASNENRGHVVIRPEGKAPATLGHFTPFTRAWFGKSVTLPDNSVIFEMNDWIYFWSPKGSRIAAVGRGMLEQVLVEP